MNQLGVNDPAPSRSEIGRLAARVDATSGAFECWPCNGESVLRDDAGIPSTKVMATHCTVTGVDISERQLAAARRNVPGATFIHADLTSVDLPARTFDGVTAFHALSHVPREEHAEVFRRIARWLVPGGLFLATLGATDSPDWIGDWLGTPMFFSSFDADENRRLVVEAGFELLTDEVVPTVEPEGPVRFLWVLARQTATPMAGA